jgi:hypothetical protein
MSALPPLFMFATRKKCCEPWMYPVLENLRVTSPLGTFENEKKPFLALVVRPVPTRVTVTPAMLRPVRASFA